MLSLTKHRKKCESIWGPKKQSFGPLIFRFHHRCPNFTDLAEKTIQNLLLKVYFAYGSCKKHIISTIFPAFRGPKTKKFGPWGTKKLHLFIGCGPSERHCQTKGPWWGTSPPVGLFKLSQNHKKQSTGP